MNTESQQEVAEQAPVDFYFTCSVLACTMKASACERNRKESSKSDSLMLKKQSGRCKSCRDWEAQQQATAISIEDYHAGVTITEKKPVVSSINFEQNRRSEWVRGNGGRSVRIN